MTLSAAALTAFAAADAAASAAALASGDMDLLDAGGAIIATFDLGTPTAAGPLMSGSGFPKTVASIAAGDIASARYRTSAGGNWKTGMTVGLAGSDAQIIVSALTVALGQSVRANSATLNHIAT